MIKLLDLYCNVFACSVGYEMAADELGIEIEITGVDREEPSSYQIPPGYTFIKSDALKFLDRFGKQFTHIHASPPCHKYSRLNVIHKKNYPDLVAPTRERLIKSGASWVMENVPGSPLQNPVKLNGQMFGLNVIRERWFECSFFMLQPLSQKPRSKTRANGGTLIQATGHSAGTLREWQDAMQLYWMNKPQLAQAIPCSYTHYLGLNWFKRN